MTAVLPQPHEGVTGVPRDADDLLTTEPGSDLVLHLVDQLHRASLSGGVDWNRELRQRLIHPEIGQPVVIQDAVYTGRGDDERGRDTRYKAVGYLLARRREWWTSDEEWTRALADGEVYPDDPRTIEPDAIYVQYGREPVDVCRWVNCTVLAVPLPSAR